LVEVRKGDVEMQSQHVELNVLVHGHIVKEYSHENKIYIEGRKGSEFTLQVVNNTSSPMLAVPSVDGLSVMDGKAASHDSGGYVLQPNSKLEIPGWRLDLKNVAKFVFTANDESYATKLGKPTNVGVIGCAFFLQRLVAQRQDTSKIIFYPVITPPIYPSDPWIPYRPYWHYSTSNSSNLFSSSAGTSMGITSMGPTDATGNVQNTYDAAYAGAGAGSAPVIIKNNAAQELGTGFGQQSEHEVNAIIFERVDQPLQVIEILYDSREGLVKRGVNLKSKPVVAAPRAFPGSFCAPPGDWTCK
jgi:hypothetical protein